MANIGHEPVKEAMSRIRQLSADEEARRLAFVRERALRDEVSFLNDARREGHEEGRREGRQEANRDTARNLIENTDLNDAAIAQSTGLPESEVQALRRERKP